MAHETIAGIYRQTNLPNESAEYLSKRETLRHAEIELLTQRERVAELRRMGPRRIEANYTWEKIASQYDELFREVAAR